ncbi:MAG: hypothetical protein CL666_03870 [Balneola sp.]|mgnify:CR=1 FL=1|nr:hypothetical protein [Balneola sp.]|tara:strand:+ start:64429 stop:65181 length:753 start_codon:yes stop_codon:yes gene_type:complete
MHYRQLITLSILLLSLSLFASCSSNSTGPSEEEQEEEPLELPTASFSVDGDTFTDGEVQFNNSSTDADSYTWEFGDGTTGNESNPTKTYSEYGEVTVTLTAENADGEDSITKTITIEPKKMFIKTLSVSAMPFTNDSGQAWDATSGPDVFVNFINDSGEGYSMGEAYSDIKKSDLPIGWEYEGAGLELSRIDFDTNFIFQIGDEDVSEHDLIENVPTDFFTITDKWLDETPESVSLTTGESTIELTLGWE